jgi:S-formylglutathione hydrolase FrmB
VTTQALPCLIESLTVTSTALVGNRYGDPTVRAVPVILPPSYHREPSRRYPVIYLLASFAGAGYQLLNRSPLAESLDERIARLLAADPSLPEWITVLPDCFTALGGSQYVNSPILGRYTDYLIREVVPLVDSNLRTLTDARHRAVCGRSSGGIGALWLAMNHPEVFSAVASHAGDGFFRITTPPELLKFTRRVRRYGGPEGALRTWLEAGKGPRPSDLFDVMTIFASAAAYSPDPSSPLGFALPVNLSDGTIDDEIFARWLRFDPVEICGEAPYRDALARQSLIFLDAGTRDEYYLDLAARKLASRLRSLGIAVTHEEFDDGHMNTNYRFDRSLPALARAIG